MKKTDKAHIWEIIAAIAAIIGCIIAIAIGVGTYNSRYDSSANASSGFEVTFNNNSNTAASTITASAGSVWYGMWQKSGSTPTDYEVYYKKTSNANYGNAVRTVTIYSNGTGGRKGDWRLARSRSSQKYDIKFKRTSNKNKKSVLRVDWAVDSYDSTGF